MSDGEAVVVIIFVAVVFVAAMPATVEGFCWFALLLLLLLRMYEMFVFGGEITTFVAFGDIVASEELLLLLLLELLLLFCDCTFLPSNATIRRIPTVPSITPYKNNERNNKRGVKTQKRWCNSCSPLRRLCFGGSKKMSEIDH